MYLIIGQRFAVPRTPWVLEALPESALALQRRSLRPRRDQGVLRVREARLHLIVGQLIGVPTYNLTNLIYSS